MTKITKAQFISGAIWKVVEQFSAKGLSMLFSIFLVRLLNPEDHGLIALTVVFTNLSDILIDGGFSTTLIRKKEVDEYDYSSVWLISISIATVLYTIIFLIAPMISSYYGEPQLKAVLRVISLLLFIQAFSSIRTAFVNRNMQFKLLFKCNFWGTAISGVLGILAAKAGWGVWALVVQRLMQQLILTALLLMRLRWKMVWRFSYSRIKQMLRFSIGVVASSLINYLSSSLYSLIIGKKYSVVDLAYFDKGGQLPTQISLYTFGAMSNVLLPTLASHQSNIERVKQIVRKVAQMTAYLIAPMMVGLALVSEEIVILLFTEKWLPIVPIMQWNCLYYFATPFMLINVQVFFALGSSSKRVKAELIRLGMMVFGAITFGIILSCSVTELALFCAVVAVLSEFITYLDVRSMIGYSFKERVEDRVLPCFSAIIMGGVILMIDSLFLSKVAFSNILRLFIKVLIGVIVYCLLSVVLKLKGFQEIMALLKSVGKRKTHE